VVRTPAYDGARIHAVRTATENLGSPPIPGRSVAVPRLTVALLRR
jgi:hypothetical protein